MVFGMLPLLHMCVCVCVCVFLYVFVDVLLVNVLTAGRISLMFGTLEGNHPGLVPGGYKVSSAKKKNGPRST
jgi:hypothetical protein